MYAWFEAGNGRRVFRRIPEPNDRRSDLPTPNVVRAFARPLQSMADGKWYDTPRELEASYRASNNPHGVDFVCVGNEDITKFRPPNRDRKADREAIERAIHDVENGKEVPILTELPV